MAVTAFVSGCLWNIWQRSNSPLKSRHPKAKDFEHLLKTDLRELKDCITELCVHLNLQPLHIAQPKVWNNLLQVVKETRDFMTHPRPEQVEFNKIIGDAFGKRSWAFPSKVAEETIGYFYDARKYTRPPWLKENREFQVPIILALSAAKRE
jgi:hypothetical protein